MLRSFRGMKKFNFFQELLQQSYARRKNAHGHIAIGIRKLNFMCCHCLFRQFAAFNLLNNISMKRIALPDLTGMAGLQAVTKKYILSDTFSI